MIVTLVAPIRFKKEIMEEFVRLSLLGHIVLLPVDLADGSKGQAVWDSEVEEVMMKLRKEKIDLCDSVHIVNVDGYMGRGTYEEIGYATVKGKPISYYTLKGIKEVKDNDEKLKELIASGKNEEDLTGEECDMIMHNMVQEDIKCAYCILDCPVKGVSDGPNGPIYPPCIDQDVSAYVDLQGYLDNKREEDAR